MDSIFKNMGMFINGITHLSPTEAYALMNDDVIFIDVREEYEIEYKKFEVKNLLYIPFSDYTNKIESLPKDKSLIIADSYGLRSKEIVIQLMAQGYYNVANLNGGILDWERDGLPLVVDKKEELNGQCPCQLKTKK
jgi:rhodanese-related sulfurtransferase